MNLVSMVDVLAPRVLRRRASLAVATASMALLIAAPACALYSVKILIPANPGGGWDQTGRALQTAMQASGTVKKVSVDNKGGAGGTIGLAQFVNGSKGDPHALLIGGTTMVGAIYANKSPVNLSQVTPIARLTGETHVVVVPGNSKIESMKELVAQFKANPGSISWGGGSAGGTDHMLAGLIAQSVGVDPSKVNYIAYAGGGEAQSAILGGHVTAGISNYGEFASQIKAGKLRALGVSSDKRIPGVEIPTLKEQGVDAELFNWRSVFAPAGITDAQKKELQDAIERTVKSEAWQTTVKRNDWTDMYMPSDQFVVFLDAEQIRVAKLMDSLGLGKK